MPVCGPDHPCGSPRKAVERRGHQVTRRESQDMAGPLVPQLPHIWNVDPIVLVPKP